MSIKLPGVGNVDDPQGLPLKDQQTLYKYLLLILDPATGVPAAVVDEYLKKVSTYEVLDITTEMSPGKHYQVNLRWAGDKTAPSDSVLADRLRHLLPDNELQLCDAVVLVSGRTDGWVVAAVEPLVNGVHAGDVLYAGWQLGASHGSVFDRLAMPVTEGQLDLAEGAQELGEDIAEIAGELGHHVKQFFTEGLPGLIQFGLVVLGILILTGKVEFELPGHAKG